jgi:hypothetical protein
VDIGVATTTQRFTQQLGVSVGFAGFGVIMTRATGTFIDAVTTVFLVAWCVALVPAVLALFIREKSHAEVADSRADLSRAGA